MTTGEQARVNLAEVRRRQTEAVPKAASEDLLRFLEVRTHGCPDPECVVCHQIKLTFAELRRRLGITSETQPSAPPR